MARAVQTEKRPPPARLCPYAFQGCKLPAGCALNRDSFLAAGRLSGSGERSLEAPYTTRYPSERRKRVNAAAKRCKYPGPAVDPSAYRTSRQGQQGSARMFA